jgi:hypothetical protein
MSEAKLTLNIAHPDSKGLHQETMQWTFTIREDGNWLQSFMDYMKEDKKDEPSKPEIIK